MEKPLFSKLREKSNQKNFPIVYKNPNIELPLKVEPLFFDPEGSIELETHPNHHRVCWYPETAIKDKLGNIFFVASVKGVGYLYPETYQSKKDNFYGKKGDKITIHKSKEYGWGYNILGVFDKRNLAPLVENSRELTEAGVRCETIAVAYDLKEILDNGRIINLKDLREYLKKEAENIGLSKKQIEDLNSFESSQLVRLSREAVRIKDFCEAPYDQKREFLERTFKKLNLENELKGKLLRYDLQDSNSLKKYLEDFFQQAAENLAILHNHGKIMCYLNSGNITLSLAEVVDLDSIISLTGKKLAISPLIANVPEKGIPKGYIKDTRDEIYALGIMFLKGFRDFIEIGQSEREKLHQAFLKAYQKKLNLYKLENIGVNASNLLEEVKELSAKMILNNQSVSPIKMS